MSVRAELTAIGHMSDASIDVLGAALCLSAWAQPGLDREPYRRHVQALFDDVVAYVHDDPLSATLASEAMRQILHRRYGYAETFDTGEQADGSTLSRVIDKRRGSPFALAVLYEHILTRLGLTVEILAFPARALLRIQDDGGHRLVVDPARDGRVLDARALRDLYREHRGGSGDLNPFTLKAYGKRDVLVGLLDQVKAHHLRHAAPEAALATLEAALLIAPDNPRLWRETGLLHARLDHIPDAISALQQFLQLPGDDAHRYTASQLLQQLQSRQDRPSQD